MGSGVCWCGEGVVGIEYAGREGDSGEVVVYED